MNILTVTTPTHCAHFFRKAEPFNFSQVSGSMANTKQVFKQKLFQIRFVIKMFTCTFSYLPQESIKRVRVQKTFVSNTHEPSLL